MSDTSIRPTATVIVYLQYRKTDHFSVLRGINHDTVWLADPSLGHVSMSKVQFLDVWQTRNGEMAGKILAIVPKNGDMVKNQVFFVNQPTRKTQFITQQIQSQRPL